MLDQNSDESFKCTVNHPMNNYRLVFLAIFSDETQVKPFWHLKIDLASCTLPASSKGILYVEINLRCIECSFPWVQFVFQPGLFQSLLQIIFCPFPVFFFPHEFLRHGGKFNMVFETELLVKKFNHLDNFQNFILYLISSHENVSIIL